MLEATEILVLGYQLGTRSISPCSKYILEVIDCSHVQCTSCIIIDSKGIGIEPLVMALNIKRAHS